MVVICSVFCFKQKTAYEMRISDWSSDVGSSALASSAINVGFFRPPPQTIKRSGRTGSMSSALPTVPAVKAVRVIAPSASESPSASAPVKSNRSSDLGQVAERKGCDRKRVVSGKSVSVRVDLGGRRIIKKKNITDISNIYP